MDHLREQEKTLCGDVLLVSAFVSYIGYFTKKYRAELLEKHWLPFLNGQKVRGHRFHPRVPPPVPTAPGAPRALQPGTQQPLPPSLQVPIPITPELDPLSLLTDSADVAAWNNQGLPSDRTSTENAAILCSTQRWPLLVDAQLQGSKWIKNKYGEDLQIVRLGQRRWAGGCGVGTGSGCTKLPFPATGGCSQGNHIPHQIQGTQGQQPLVGYLTPPKALWGPGLAEHNGGPDRAQWEESTLCPPQQPKACHTHLSSPPSDTWTSLPRRCLRGRRC